MLLGLNNTLGVFLWLINYFTEYLCEKANLGQPNPMQTLFLELGLVP